LVEKEEGAIPDTLIPLILTFFTSQLEVVFKLKISGEMPFVEIENVSGDEGQVEGKLYSLTITKVHLFSEYFIPDVG